MKKYDVAIVGAGLAGLTAAIHLSKAGLTIVLIEKNTFPKHKVCGEYISNEIWPYFDYLGIDIESLHPTHISKMHFSTADGSDIKTELPLGGFGISRYTLDHFLFEKAISNGCHFVNDTVVTIDFQYDEFTIASSENGNFTAKNTIGAFGKRSNIDQHLHRKFIQKRSPWLAVKSHYSGEFPNDCVGLHNFEGGYCGVSKVEDNVINICYIVDYKTFKRFKNTTDFEREVLCENPHLNTIFANVSSLFQKPLTISQISFEKKKAIENHTLMIGDAAGLIHPFCGNGMAMAIHAAKIASELLIDFHQKQITRVELEMEYSKQWSHNFSNRLKSGRLLSKLLQSKTFSRIMLRLCIAFPPILNGIIERTHGKPIRFSA